MDQKSVQSYMLRYLEATNCHIIEKSPTHITVKLSPQADRALTNRPFYWSFIERTGAECETMQFIFIFDSTHAPEIQNKLLQTHAACVSTGPRQLAEQVTYGSKRFETLFQASIAGGACVSLFEIHQPELESSLTNQKSHPYETWLNINYKVEFCCDMKREEIHSLAVSLVSGKIVSAFYDFIKLVELSPCLPVNVFLQPTLLSPDKALNQLENFLREKINQYDQQWAIDAQLRLQDELSQIEYFYLNSLEKTETETYQSINQHYENRKQEITWQFEPKIKFSVINGGLFHLKSNHFAKKDA